MSNINLSDPTQMSLPFPGLAPFNPKLKVVVAESELCDHEILTTFIDGEFVGVYIEKDGMEVFSYLKEADSVLASRKDQ